MKRCEDILESPKVIDFFGRYQSLLISIRLLLLVINVPCYYINKMGEIILEVLGNWRKVFHVAKPFVNIYTPLNLHFHYLCPIEILSDFKYYNF